MDTTFFSDEQLLLSLVILIHFFGHAPMHSPHTMHLNVFSSHVAFCLSTFIASAGHFLWHRLQWMQFSGSKYILPLVLSKGSLVFTGYSLVAGLLSKFLKTRFNIPDIVNPPYLSVQLMHGSMVRTRTGTSDNLHPGSILSRVGIFAKVGVLIFNLLKFFVPFALR